MLIQAFVAQATNERFDESVPLRLAWRDIIPLDAGVLAPGQDGMTSQLSPFSLTTMHGSPRRSAMAANFPHDTPA